MRMDVWGTAIDHILAGCHQTIDITQQNQRISSSVDAHIETRRDYSTFLLYLINHLS